MKVDRATYLKLKEELAEVGVIVQWSSCYRDEFDIYFINNYEQVVGGWGNDLQKKLVKEFNERDSR